MLQSRPSTGGRSRMSSIGPATFTHAGATVASAESTTSKGLGEVQRAEARRLFCDDSVDIEPGPLFTTSPVLISMYPASEVIAITPDRPGGEHQVNGRILSYSAGSCADLTLQSSGMHPAILQELRRRVHALHGHFLGLQHPQSALTGPSACAPAQQRPKRRTRAPAQAAPSYTESDYEWGFSHKRGGQSRSRGPRDALAEAEAELAAHEAGLDHHDEAAAVDSNAIGTRSRRRRVQHSEEQHAGAMGSTGEEAWDVHGQHMASWGGYCHSGWTGMAGASGHGHHYAHDGSGAAQPPLHGGEGVPQYTDSPEDSPPTGSGRKRKRVPRGVVLIRAGDEDGTGDNGGHNDANGNDGDRSDSARAQGQHEHVHGRDPQPSPVSTSADRGVSPALASAGARSADGAILPNQHAAGAGSAVIIDRGGAAALLSGASDDAGVHMQGVGHAPSTSGGLRAAATAVADDDMDRLHATGGAGAADGNIKHDNGHAEQAAAGEGPDGAEEGPDDAVLHAFAGFSDAVDDHGAVDDDNDGDDDDGDAGDHYEDQDDDEDADGQDDDGDEDEDQQDDPADYEAGEDYDEDQDDGDDGDCAAFAASHSPGHCEGAGHQDPDAGSGLRRSGRRTGQPGTGHGKQQEPASDSAAGHGGARPHKRRHVSLRMLRESQGLGSSNPYGFDLGDHDLALEAAFDC